MAEGKEVGDRGRDGYGDKAGDEEGDGEGVREEEMDRDGEGNKEGRGGGGRMKSGGWGKWSDELEGIL